MAYLLYKYIKNKASNIPTGKERTQHIPQLSQESTPPFDSQEPTTSFELPDHSGNCTDTELESKTAAKTSSNGPVMSPEEKRAARIYRWKLVAGLCLPFSLQALETTIVAGALPFIASDFNQLPQLNWIISAFNLCSATFIPFWGQIADVFGRYAALQSALLIVILGSALSAGAPVTAFPMLLVGRALQGMGSAGLNIIVRTVLADKVSLRENAKNTSIFTIVAGIAYGVGPVIGGYLTDVSWRWCFIINCPIGVVSLLLAHFVLRSEVLGPQEIKRTDGKPTDLPSKPTFFSRLATVDFGGQLLFLFGMGLLVLALTWGGSSYAWSSPQVLCPLIISGVLLLAFLVWEYFMIPGNYLAQRSPYRKAMIPLALLSSRNAGILIYINFITGMAMYAVFYFVDIYFTIVLEFTAGQAGRNIVYYLPGLALGAYAAIFLCTVIPRQTYFPLFIGTLLEPLGITLLAYALSTQNTNLIYGMLALTGVGTGIRFMPGSLHGVGYYRKHISSIVSCILLAVSLGGTVGLTVMSNIFNNRLAVSGVSFTSSSSFDSISALPAFEQDYFREKVKSAITVAFYAITAFLWLGLVAMTGMGNVWIGKETGEESRVCDGSYLGWLFRGAKAEDGEKGLSEGSRVPKKGSGNWTGWKPYGRWGTTGF